MLYPQFFSFDNLLKFDIISLLLKANFIGNYTITDESLIRRDCKLNNIKIFFSSELIILAVHESMSHDLYTHSVF